MQLRVFADRDLYHRWWNRGDSGAVGAVAPTNLRRWSIAPSLVPRPPTFFVLWFSFSIIYGSEIFLRSSVSVYYTERKLKNKKRGRPGNEAT